MSEKPKEPKVLDSERWDAAVDEWEANLDLLGDPAEKKPPAAEIENFPQLSENSNALEANTDAALVPLTRVSSTEELQGLIEKERESVDSGALEVGEEEVLTDLPSTEVGTLRVDMPEMEPVAPLFVVGMASGTAKAAPPDREELQRRLTVIDAQRSLEGDSKKVADLACAAGRLCEQLNNFEGALQRYESAATLDPEDPIAAAGVRRALMTLGRFTQALEAVDRELKFANELEAQGLKILQLDLALLAGSARFNQSDSASESLPLALAYADLTAATATGKRAEALMTVSGVLGERDRMLSTSYALESGRRAEFFTPPSREMAAAGYQTTLRSSGNHLGAALGMFRLEPNEKSAARLTEIVPSNEKSALASALARQHAQIAFLSGDPESAIRSLKAACIATDDALSLSDLVDLVDPSAPLGDLVEARTALQRLCRVERDLGLRADTLIRLGEMEERQGNSSAAASAYATANGDYPQDPRSASGLQRTQEKAGDKESALKRHLDAAEREPSRTPVEWTRAARLLVELGRPADALDRVLGALESQPAFLPAVELATEIQLQAGKPGGAATVLQRASDAVAVEDPQLGQVLGERAVRMWMRAGRLPEARKALAPLTSGDYSLSGLWLEQQILPASESEAKIASWRAEAEICEADSTGDAVQLREQKLRAAELWHAIGLELSTNPDRLSLIESHRRALWLDPSHGPAAMELVSQLYQMQLPFEVQAPYQTRLGSAVLREGAQAEAAFLALELGHSFEVDAQNLQEAARAYTFGFAGVFDFVVGEEAQERVAHRLGDADLKLKVLERALKRESLSAGQFALQIQLGDLYSSQLDRPDEAAEWYGKALKLHNHAVARDAFERAAKRAHLSSELADLALNQLKKARDPQHRVAAYERLAWVDAHLRDDPQSALLAYESILELDGAHAMAIRQLERSCLDRKDPGALVALYEQVAPQLAQVDSAWSVALLLLCARLRTCFVPPDATTGDIEAAIAADHRAALTQNPRLLPSLRWLYARARARRDFAGAAQFSLGLAECRTSDPATEAILFTRSGEASFLMRERTQAEAQLLCAIEVSERHLPALVLLGDLALADRNDALALRAAELKAVELANSDLAVREYLVAATLSEQSEPDRAVQNLRQALELDPECEEAFDRLRTILSGRNDAVGEMELLKQRCSVEKRQDRAIKWHLETASLARLRLRDSASAEEELKAVLELNPDHNQALTQLSDLYFEQKRFAEAEELLLRQARLARSRTVAKTLFLRLGVIYALDPPFPLADAKKAQAAFSRVLAVDPNDQDALEHLAEVQIKEQDWATALKTLQQLISLQTESARRLKFIQRAAFVYEEGLSDSRSALQLLRDAVESQPTDLLAIRALGKFYTKKSDLQSTRLLYDRSAARFLAQVDAEPRDPVPYHSLFRIFHFKETPDRAAMAAGVLDYLGATDSEEREFLQSVRGRDGYPGSSFADPALDETLIDPRVPIGLANLFGLLEEPFAKLYRTDAKKLDLQTSDKVQKNHALYSLAHKIGTDLGVPPFDLYVASDSGQARTLRLELTNPRSLVIGHELVDGAHEMELRFYLGRVLKMWRAHLLFPMQLAQPVLGILLGGIIRLFAPEFVPSGVREADVEEERVRLVKALPKKLLPQLMPYALQCASDELTAASVSAGLHATANRAGLLVAGAARPSLHALERLQREGELKTLLRFCFSDEVAELRRQLGVGIG